MQRGDESRNRNKNKKELKLTPYMAAKEMGVLHFADSA
jgi:hypothetical protein